ncbi:MAG TPA: GNAT family N-acetyltransferase [Bryobacteraceae bacterium]|jgi:RimJ/RimL family protein N-acetyltransferase|nr:GNAT family N-acetyltransferase [Bryobacteraceae bacterium]
MVTTLTTDRLILRAWRETDRAPFAELNADPRVMEFMPQLLSRAQSDDFCDRIQGHFDEHGFGLCAAEHRATGAFLGFIGLLTPKFEAPFMPAVEIGWRLGSQWWGQGLATEGAREMVRYAFDEIGLEALVSFTVPGNWRSRRVMEKLGMTHDPSDDFEHPRFAPGHPQRRHVLYQLRRSA